ncbi:MAG: carboxypeptidase regulatory-like domain-containing protein [Chloroflexota bacterium]
MNWKANRLLTLIGAGVALTTLLFACAPRTATLPSTATLSGNTITGVVLDLQGAPLEGATVRVKASENQTTSAADGSFTLPVESEAPVFVTAWKSGYYINGVESVQPGASGVEIVLKKHAEVDNPDYEWLSAFASAGKEGNCENCHSALAAGLTPGPSSNGRGESLPFDEWKLDAHALAAQNPRFLTMYLGADVDGNQSPPTRYASDRDYGRFPLRPDLSLPYFGPGYKLDFPDTSGNCAACHLPAAAIDNPYGVDAAKVDGVGREGVACDFCHKIWDVRLDPITQLPMTNMPGVLSFEFRRPPEGHQFFAGPLDDVAPGEDTFAPIQRQSQFCAPCHFGVFWNTTVYNSFGEWLDSPYSAADGKTCQDCHMPAGKADHFVRLDRGGVTRDPATIFSHLMPGASSPDLLRAAVTMNVSASRSVDALTVTVTIVNDQAGHHVPTDSPLRQMILLVSATDGEGQALSLREGPIIPDYGGVGDPNDGYYAGLPGKIYAKILMELWTEIAPTGAYWNPTRLIGDNRLAAFESDTSVYVFQTSQTSQVSETCEVSVKLIFRRAFKSLMDQKGWDVPDILMEEEKLTIP